MQRKKNELKTQKLSINHNIINIGNSTFADDIWDIEQLIPAKTIGKGDKVINFLGLPSSDLKYTVKQYAYYKLSRMKPATLTSFLRITIPAFAEFCKANGINSFTKMGHKEFLSYAIWLKDSKNPALSTGYKYSLFVEEVIKFGQIKGWNVSKSKEFKGSLAYEIWNPKKNKEKNKTKPIQEDIFDIILNHAKYDERDIIVKAGIIIQSQTGLRISEVLSICEGCLRTTNDGFDYIEVLLSKTEKGEPIPHKVYANELVKEVVFELSGYTAKLRAESGLKELFIRRAKGKIRVMNAGRWSCYQLRGFVKRWDIRDTRGELYDLSSHQFRATLVKELIKRKVPIAFIMKQFSHISIEMTVHYLTLQQSEVKAIYSEMILNPKAKIAGLRVEKIKSSLEKLFHGKTEDEINDVISELSETMSFNTLPTGICLYDFRRGNCTDGDGCFFYNCPNYITSTDFYPVLKAEFDLLELEMKRLKDLFQERAWQVKYVVWKELKRLIIDLEVQMNG